MDNSVANQGKPVAQPHLQHTTVTMDYLAHFEEGLPHSQLSSEEIFGAARAHNAGLAVNNLPTEVLCAIFLEVACSYQERYHLGWIRILKVCSHW